MLMNGASHPQFKAISYLIKEHAQGENPFNTMAANGGSASPCLIRTGVWTFAHVLGTDAWYGPARVVCE